MGEFPNIGGEKNYLPHGIVGASLTRIRSNLIKFLDQLHLQYKWHVWKEKAPIYPVLMSPISGPVLELCGSFSCLQQLLESSICRARQVCCSRIKLVWSNIVRCMINTNFIVQERNGWKKNSFILFLYKSASTMIMYLSIFNQVNF